MNTDSLRRIEEVSISSGVLSFLEIAQDTIYIDILNVELGNPEIQYDLRLSIRFAGNSFINFFYDDIWNIEFISKFDPKYHRLEEELHLKIKNIKFLDFKYLNSLKGKFSKSKVLSEDPSFDLDNLRCDFFILLEFDLLAVVVGANHMDFFSQSEKLDDYLLKELSNQWVYYFLKYISKRNILNKDSICENSSLNFK